MFYIYIIYVIYKFKILFADKKYYFIKIFIQYLNKYKIVNIHIKG